MFYQIFSFGLVYLSVFLAISSSSWISSWVAMELGSIGFLPILSWNGSLMSKLSAWKYFLVQAISSSVFLFSILGISGSFFSNWQELSNDFFSFILMASIFMKMGIFPFHGWLISVVENCSWMKFFIISTVQKVVPLCIFFNLSFSSTLGNWISYFWLSCSVLMSLSCFFENSTRKFLTFSSMLNISWVCLAINLESALAFFFFFSYTFTLFSCCLLFQSSSVYFQSDFFFLESSSWSSKFLKVTLMGSLCGLPPFAGFFPKLLVLQEILNSFKFHLVPFLFLFSSSVMVLFYLPFFSSSGVLAQKKGSLSHLEGWGSFTFFSYLFSSLLLFFPFLMFFFW
nr:NADH dehydrogenase subunit 2 [Chelopistes texanus]